MKIRTEEDLSDKLTADLSWRKKELMTLKLKLVNEENPLFIRTGYVLLSAHFEGFFSTAINYYLIYVSMRNLPLNSLKPALQALQLRNSFDTLSNTKKISQYSNVMSKYISIANNNFSVEKRYKPPAYKIVSTKSNPKPDTLKEILLSAGLDENIYSTKDQFIDNDLLKIRHQVAHGEHTDLNYRNFTDALSVTIDLLDITYEHIIAAVDQKLYLS